MQLTIEVGASAIIVGANGGGKTRLAVYIEGVIDLKTHRVSAHRALSLNPQVAKISEQLALQGLKTGHAREGATVAHRIGSRWGSNMAVSLLNDFDFLVQVMFADQANKSLQTHQKVRAGERGPAEPTKFERLVEIWSRLLPHRLLHISGDNIEVSVPNAAGRYKASDMSDGERAIFYLIAQTLAAAEGSLLIFDEPELHVHRSIMSKLWDELEAGRPDCAFLLITHDLEFASSRVAQKFVIRDYDPAPNWSIEEVPANTGFSEELTTLILGSRKPVLFVEGGTKSIDLAIYRCCFPDWTVIPKGSCEEVIHSVVTMRRNKGLTRVNCSGIVDADDQQVEDIKYLATLGVAVLPVSEIENLILLPSVSRAIAQSEGYTGADLEARLKDLKEAIFRKLSSPAAIEEVVIRYCRRRIDRILKKIDLSEAINIDEIAASYHLKTNALDINAIARQVNQRIQTAIREDDLSKLLANYDDKGQIMALAAQYLKGSRPADFESWITRTLRNNTVPAITAAIHNTLPRIGVQ